MSPLDQALSALHELESDSTVPKNLKAKLGLTIKLLEGQGEVCMRASKALGDIEFLSSDANLPSHMRTQLFGIISMLEIVD